MKIYHNPKCSTSRKALHLLEEKEFNPTIVAYLTEKLSKKEIKEILKRGNLKIKDILRTKDKVFKTEFANKQLSEDEWIDAIIRHPSILERPIIITKDTAVIPRPFEKIEVLFKD